MYLSENSGSRNMMLPVAGWILFHAKLVVRVYSIVCLFWFMRAGIPLYRVIASVPATIFE